MAFLSWGDENVLILAMLMVVQLCNILKTSKSCMLNGWMVWFVSYIFINLLPKEDEGKAVELEQHKARVCFWFSVWLHASFCSLVTVMFLQTRRIVFKLKCYHSLIFLLSICGCARGPSLAYWKLHFLETAGLWVEGKSGHLGL